MTYRPIFRHPVLSWVLFFPTLLILVMFLYYPVIQSLVLSTYRSNLILGTRSFIGLQNFASIFLGSRAPAFWQATIQTIVFGLLVTGPSVAIGMVLATIASHPMRGGRFYRIMLIWPFALSPAIAGTIFLFMFNPEVGVINQVLSSLFGIKPRWLDDPQLAFGVAVAAAIWKNLGYNIVFYLAALQNVPANLSEAAEIDGAGGIVRFFKITVPMLSPTTFFLVFTNLAYSFFNIFGLIDILTAGGPVGRGIANNTGVTTTLIIKIFRDGFGGSSNMGIAAAQGVVLMALAVSVTLAQFRLGRSGVHYEGG
ncbi:MAG: carbohydrate ABC transporter permease [Spirochaetia bacterium]